MSHTLAFASKERMALTRRDLPSNSLEQTVPTGQIDLVTRERWALLQNNYHHLPSPNERIDKIAERDIGLHIMENAIPRINRSPSAGVSLTTIRTFLQTVLVTVGCTLSAIPPLSAAELFPFAPPPFSQQRTIEPSAQVKPQLSAEDRVRIAKVAAQARNLSTEDQKRLRTSIRKSLNEAAAQGNLKQVQYLTELLQQME